MYQPNPDLFLSFEDEKKPDIVHQYLFYIKSMLTNKKSITKEIFIFYLLFLVLICEFQILRKKHSKITFFKFVI